MTIDKHGEITELNIPMVDLLIPIQINSEKRWICHAIHTDTYSPNPNQQPPLNTLLCFLIDNYGEIYILKVINSGNGVILCNYPVSSEDGDILDNKNNIYVYDNISSSKTFKLDIDPSTNCGPKVKSKIVCEPKENISEPLKNPIIDLLKISFVPSLHHARYISQYPIKNMVLTIRKYIQSIKNILNIRISSQKKYIVNTEKWTSKEESYVGMMFGYLLDDTFLVLTYNNMKDRQKFEEGIEVWTSWNNWKKPYELLDNIINDGSVYTTGIGFDYGEELPKFGKHHYKLKKNGIWIEPPEDLLREKDKNGIWNNVIFIHGHVPWQREVDNTDLQKYFRKGLTLE